MVVWQDEVPFVCRRFIADCGNFMNGAKLPFFEIVASRGLVKEVGKGNRGSHGSLGKSCWRRLKGLILINVLGEFEIAITQQRAVPSGPS